MPIILRGAGDGSGGLCPQLGQAAQLSMGLMGAMSAATAALTSARQLNRRWACPACMSVALSAAELAHRSTRMRSCLAVAMHSPNKQLA